MRTGCCIVLLLAIVFTSAFAESIELSNYFGKTIDELKTVLTDISDDSDENTVSTTSGDVYASVDEDSKLINFIYISGNEGYTLCNLYPGLTYNEVIDTLDDSLIVYDDDYDSDNSILLTNEDYSMSVTVEFEDDICIAISETEY